MVCDQVQLSEQLADLEKALAQAKAEYQACRDEERPADCYKSQSGKIVRLQGSIAEIETRLRTCSQFDGVWLMSVTDMSSGMRLPAYSGWLIFSSWDGYGLEGELELGGRAARLFPRGTFNSGSSAIVLDTSFWIDPDPNNDKVDLEYRGSANLAAGKIKGVVSGDPRGLPSIGPEQWAAERIDALPPRPPNPTREDRSAS
ncbi:hypothetical protein PUR71_05570 [Streptomyces sp. SP17BM10]|uniref:hypothetical protein n=1 Tax=Streptomyces sp. SP17BM10 TaxID=3002530 RepID=UPI002E77FF94|nr:hypothetical protein [Streptomyces sp. SP17BM10]MEE1782397.1 hypothetical protein [Streptomyces sp. SP17BM10]